jgi:hypothetical protein
VMVDDLNVTMRFDSLTDGDNTSCGRRVGGVEMRILLCERWGLFHLLSLRASSRFGHDRCGTSSLLGVGRSGSDGVQKRSARGANCRR